MYPVVMELFESVGVEMEVSAGSFSVSLDEGQGFEWGTQNGLSSLFAQKKNALNPWFWKISREIIKFKKDASIYIEELDNNSDIERNETLGHFVQSRGYSVLFQEVFLIPICASIWPCSSPVMTFSAYLILSLLCNLDILELLGVPNSFTSRWRSQSYINRIKEELENRCCKVKTSSEIYSVLTSNEGCAIICKDGLEEAYDGCVIAAHAPDALKILGKQATFDEIRVLDAFHYADSDIFFHRDDKLMPKTRAAWSSRNFLGSTNDKACITYWLNNFENSSECGVPFFLTLNPPGSPKSTLCKWSTSHPIPSLAACRASSQLNVIQGKRGLWFCGAYQGYGFPEDGIKAGILAANSLLRKHYTFPSNPKHMVPSYLELGARVLVWRFFQRFIATGCLILLEEGKAFTFKGTRRQSTLKVTLRVHKPQFYWKVATENDLGFADAFIDGDISFIDANEGLLTFFLLIIENSEMNYTLNLNKKRERWTNLFYTSVLASAKKFFKHISMKNTLSQVSRNISKHYNISNELFSLFMDETMMYSCALFENPGEDLRDAQLRKIHTLIKKARINSDHHILEIGCGWGGLALEVVKMTGCKYTGISLSKNQLQYVESKVAKAGLQDQIELLFCDYRRLPKNSKYDRIIVCEMIEHVGHDFMEEFFKCCESHLAECGIFVLQFIAVADEKYDEWRSNYGFAVEYIFNGGCLPSLNRVISAMAASSRLSVVHLEEIGNHYYDTLKLWRQNFRINQSEILALGFDEKFIRIWEYYFNYTAAGFKHCITGDYQIVFNRPGDVAAFGSAPYNPSPPTY